MSALETLRTGDVEVSVAWEAAKQLFGTGVGDWEPDTLRIELRRREVEPTDSLVTKLLAAQTVHQTNAWAYDHDAIFAFALACDGVPASYEDVRQPTVEQLAWAMHELRTLTEHPLDQDEGFDPDEVDAAVAVVLLDEGFAVAPSELAFCGDVLAGLTHTTDEFRRQVREGWAALEDLPIEELKRIVGETDEDELGVQLRRLADVKCYVSDRLQRRERQNAVLRGHANTDSSEAIGAG